MGVVIVYSVGGADVAEVVEEDVAGEPPYNSNAPIPAATATAAAPAYFRKRRLEGFR
jgi:hypothetical protein